MQNEHNTEMTSTNVNNIKFPLPSSKNEFLYGFAESVLIARGCVKLQLMHHFFKAAVFSLRIPSLMSGVLLFFSTAYTACEAKTAMLKNFSQ